MNKTLEEQHLEAIDVTYPKYELKKRLAKKCANVSRDYAKRFAEWVGNNGFEHGFYHSEHLWFYKSGETIGNFGSTEELLQKFESESSINKQ